MLICWLHFMLDILKIKNSRPHQSLVMIVRNPLVTEKNGQFKPENNKVDSDSLVLKK